MYGILQYSKLFSLAEWDEGDAKRGLLLFRIYISQLSLSPLE